MAKWNSEKSPGGIFSTLAKIFSTGVIIRNVGGKDSNRLQVIDTYSQQAMGNLATNYLVSRFSNISGGNWYNQQYSYTNMPITQQRIWLFRDYEMMDQDAILSAALDIYGEEACVQNDYGNVLNVVTEDGEVKEVLENLYFDILDVNKNLYFWTRTTCKYGDWFLKLDLAERLGVTNVLPIMPHLVTRQEGTYEDNQRVIFKIEGMPGQVDKMEYDGYEIAHFRIMSDPMYYPYGKSMLEGARKTWQQLMLMEEAMLIHRVVRAPQKRAFKIQVGNLGPDAAMRQVDDFINTVKRVPIIDEETGNYNFRYNIENIQEDFFIPVRGDMETVAIDTIGGLEYAAIDDIEYLRNKVFAALRIPKAFLTYEEATGSRATLSIEDLRFAKTIHRIQSYMISELKKIGMVHLMLMGYSYDKIAEFEVTMNNSSTIFEQEKIDIWKNRIELANSMIEQKTFPLSWIYKNVYNFTEDDLKEFDSEIEENMLRSHKLNNLLENGGQEESSEEDMGSDDWGDSEEEDFTMEEPEEQAIEDEVQPEEEASEEDATEPAEIGSLSDNIENNDIPDDFNLKGNQKLTKETKEYLKNSLDNIKMNKKLMKQII